MVCGLVKKTVKTSRLRVLLGFLPPGAMAESLSDDEGSSDFQLVKIEPETPKFVDDEVTIAQLPPLQTSPAPFTPSTHLLGKRKRLMRLKLKLPSRNAEKKRSPSKHKAPHDPVLIRAKEVQSSLGTDYPTFVKTMLRSHVTVCFWMGLPVPFCRSFLPKQDDTIVLEDENKRQYNLKYIAHKTGLSAGWRKFSLVNKLLEGDVLIFQLVESCKFKVYVIRSNDSKQVDQSVLDLSNHIEHETPMTKPMTPVKQDFSLERVKTFKDFHIMVKDRCIDSELSEEIRMNYYKLCKAKKDFLHDNLPEGLYYKLVAGMIGETLNIANAIRNCDLTTTREEFETWDSSLKSFELMGMKVGFIRDRIRALTTLRFENEDAKIYVEAKEARKQNAYRIKILKGKLLELKESNEKIDEVLISLGEKAEWYEAEFEEKVNAPW